MSVLFTVCDMAVKEYVHAGEESNVFDAVRDVKHRGGQDTLQGRLLVPVENISKISVT